MIGRISQTNKALLWLYYCDDGSDTTYRYYNESYWPPSDLLDLFLLGDAPSAFCLKRPRLISEKQIHHLDSEIPLYAQP